MLTDLPDLDTSIDYPASTSGDAELLASRPSAHHGALLIFTLLWGGNFVLAEVALRELSPISFSVSRFLTAGFVLLGIYYTLGIQQSKKEQKSFQLIKHVDRSDWPRLLLVSILGATLAPWFGIEGLNLTSGGRASLWLAVCPVLSAGIGYFLNTERIGKRGLIGLIVAGIGTIGLAIDGFDGEQGVFLGDLYLMLAICCIAAELHLTKPLVLKYGATSVVAARTAIGGLCYFLIASSSIFAEEWSGLSAWTWIAILAGGAIGVGIGQWVKTRALNVIGPTRIVLYGNLVPPATLLIAWIALGANPTTTEIIAGLLILGGATGLQMSSGR